VRMSAIILALVLMPAHTSTKEPERQIMLPNPQLLGCQAAACSQLWLQNSASSNAVYPYQLTIDMLNHSTCPLGILARYDSSVPLSEIQAEVDSLYAGSALPSNATVSALKLWRVESEKFAIQLAAVAKDSEGITFAQAFQPPKNQKHSHPAKDPSTQDKELIYLAFTGSGCHP
jgi:hypothetical protein